MNQVRLAANLLGYANVDVANIFPEATDNVPAISSVGCDRATWLAGREALAAHLQSADALLASWGVSAPSGAARLHMRDQVEWIVQAASTAGHKWMWTVEGLPRHPSRWHRVVSDRNERWSEVPANDRLERALVQVPTVTLRSR